jgi:Effector protein
MPLQYSEGILITDKWKDGRDEGVLPTRNGHRQDFVDTTKACLDELKRLSAAAQMFKEIDASGHVVSIYRTKSLTDGNACGGGDPTKMMVQPLDGKYSDGTTVLSHVLDQASEDLSGRSRLQRFFNLGKAKPRFLKRDAIARLVGTTASDFEAMEKGKKPIPPLVDAKLRSYLYNFLIPGEGDARYVKFNHKRDNLSPQHKQYLPQSHTWQNRPPAIALGHELVHAWRGVSGLKLFDYGWEEEAMTVGLPPFAYMEFTENKFRCEYGGLAIRPDYQNIGKKTTLTDGQKLGLDSKNAWQGDQGALHPQQTVAQAMSARRRGMGMDDDDGDDEWDD